MAIRPGGAFAAADERHRSDCSRVQTITPLLIMSILTMAALLTLILMVPRQMESQRVHGIHLGHKGVPMSLLWALCMYCNDAWTLWEWRPPRRRTRKNRERPKERQTTHSKDQQSREVWCSRGVHSGQTLDGGRPQYKKGKVA